MTINSIIDILKMRSEKEPENTAFTYIDDKNIEHSISYSGLYDRCSRLGNKLAEKIKPGECVLLFYPSGLDFIYALLACFKAGIIAAPLYPPRRNQNARRIASVLENSKAGCILTCAKHLQNVSAYIEAGGFAEAISIIDTDSLELDSVGSETNHYSDIAFIQYTSGSTGDPKGVMVGHDNIIGNLEALVSHTRVNSQDIFVNWLPLFHDLGLINTILLPIYIGAHSVFISPAYFIRRPATWLELISRYRGTVCGAPNFAYDLCVEKVIPDSTLNLSSWRIAFNAAEPINPDTLEAFSQKYAAYGFNTHAHYPSYGMAEATVFISGANLSEGAKISSFDYEELKQGVATAANTEGRRLVSCGTAPLNHDLKIVDPDSGKLLSEGQVGEVWFSGPSVAKGYLGREELSKEIFSQVIDGKQYLRTGDLGFMHEGELYVSGRIKDLVIINGLNFYPQDLERSASSACDELRDGVMAAFSCDQDGREEVVLIAEIESKFRKRLETDADFVIEIEKKVKEAIFVEHEISLSDLRIVPPNSVPMTSSGKIQRRQCKELFLQGKFDNFSNKKQTSSASTSDFTDSPIRKSLFGIWAACLKVNNEQVNIDSNFFADGGDSISAIRMIAEIENLWGIKLSEDALFLYPDFTSLAQHIEGLLQDVNKDNEVIMATDNKSGEVSHAQNRLWVLHQSMESKAIFNLPVIIDFPDVNLAALKSAIQLLLKKHEILRTAYESIDGQLLQRVLDFKPLEIPNIDLSSVSQIDAEIESKNLANQQADYQFDLAAGEIVSALLIQLPDKVTRLLFTVHHIACDIWSMRLLLRDLVRFYQLLVAGTKESAIDLNYDLGSRYIDYSQWQRNRLNNNWPMTSELENYWKSHLANAPLVLPLPCSYARPKVQTYRGKEIHQTLSFETTQSLKQFAKKNNSTPFVVGLTAYYLLMGILSNQDDIVVGTDIANRNDTRIQQTVGFFVNQLAIRVSLSGNPSLNTLLARVKKSVIDAHRHQELPFDRVIDIVGVPRATDYSPIFQVKFLLSAMPDDELQEVGAILQHKESHFSQYDLTLNLELNAAGEQIARLHFNQDLFSIEQAERILSCYMDVLQILIQHPDYKVIDVYRLTGEKNSHKTVLAGPVTDQNTDLLLTQIERIAISNPQATAVVCTESRINYQALNTRVNQLANLIFSLDLEADSPVAIFLDRSTEMVIAMLACLKIGHPFIPLDQDFPTDRIQRILDESDAGLLITSQNYEHYFTDYYGCILALESIAEMLSCQEKDYQGTTASPDKTAYILFTSGSEGKPKGVVVKHRSLLNLCRWYIDFSSINSTSRVLHLIPFCFDAAVKNILAPLMVGASLALFDKNKLDIKSALEFCGREKCTHLNCLPSVLSAMLQQDISQDYARVASFEFVALGAEVLDLSKLMPWIRSRNYHATLANIYGPTECTDICCAYSIEKDEIIEVLDKKPGNNSLPIGTPIFNVKTYVVSHYEGEDYIAFPCATGELLVAGECLSEGYLHNKTQTEKVFVKRPFADGLLYKTGDLVRLDENGHTWFVSRRDHQIKFNGIRIEPQEIELALTTCEGVLQARVLQKDNVLAALVVSQSLTPPTKDELLSHLAKRLPFRTLPNVYVVLSEFPLLPSGKVDQNKLYDILEMEVHKTVEFIEPESPEEKVIASIFRTALGIEVVGANDGFFSLGGDSITAIQVISLAKEQGFNISVPDIFEHQTVSQLAKFCASNKSMVSIEADDEDLMFDMMSDEDLARLKEHST